jgi:pyruvate/2-oxoglutarate dehydrogenase complex dihydrolipoamide dehydrogenase (E3) component
VSQVRGAHPGPYCHSIKIDDFTGLIVHAAGRTPEIDDMNLDVARVAWDERGVKVNEFLQSVSNPAVYAGGDAAATGGPPLTPVAEYEGALVRAAGWQVAIIDSRPFGGTCALRGCDPKKVLVGTAEVIDWARRMKGNGIRSEQLSIDWRELMHFKRTFTAPVPKRREEGLAKEGIVALHGRAHFVGPNAVQVGDEVLQARFVVIAAG